MVTPDTGLGGFNSVRHASLLTRGSGMRRDDLG